MRLSHASALLLALVASAVGAAPPGESIRVPSGPVVPTPMPTPADPEKVIRLTADHLFVIDADGPCLVLSSPRGVVSVTEETGPVRIRGRFVDEPGKVQTRNYKGKAIFTVEGLVTGRCEILVVPAGAKADQVIRRTLQVEAGEGPIPPPKPPEPKPVDPPAPKPAASLRVFLVFESADTLAPAQRAVLYGKAVEEWLDRNCTGGKDGWRRRDKDAPGEADPKMAALWKAIQPNVKTTPCVAVERDGKVELIDLGETPAKMVETLDKYKGGK